MTKPCIKCLLSEINPGEELKKIQKLIELMPETEKVLEADYNYRLAICKECDKLNQGTCLACGCYAELRAIKRKSSCPDKKW